ncbi:YybH family protein [Pontibacter mangrovi]|uniref:Nuclear transport factor 2 family protein n=1 Tax=Pontibacter mangrovi TaxID=2589816 RepID=A0A501W2Q6_9BACT|nr:nuclear transport factor 2 family protein [Pontibacter mangrovi]TPE42915.1 nuclear transport factor 2 family protein [Pontibacter mangrovi]
MKNKLYLLLALCLFGFAGCRSAKSPSGAASDRAAVSQVLADQAACWSRGDLECYMQGYWQSDSLLFVGSRGLTYGWQQTLANYKKGYPDASAMGKLNFKLKELRQLSPETMLVVGKWHLAREAAKGDLEGYFSVIFRKFPEGWKIIADHSS